MSKTTKPLAGKTITLPVFVRAEARDFEIYKLVDGFDLRATGSPHLCKDEFLVCETTVTFTVPEDFDPVAPMVAGLEAEKRRLTAEFSASVAAINQRLAKLQAIEHVAA